MASISQILKQSKTEREMNKEPRMCFCQNDCQTVYSTEAYLQVMTKLSEAQTLNEKLLFEIRSLQDCQAALKKAKLENDRLQDKLDCFKQDLMVEVEGMVEENRKLNEQLK